MRPALKTRLFQKLPPRLAPRVRVARIATAPGGMPWRARFALLPVIVLLGRRNVSDVTVRLPGGSVFLGGDSLYVDCMTLGYIWGEGVFAPNCRERVVVDLGAHKGYFATWALANGAAQVHSIEPESGNFARLERAQQAHAREDCWSIERSAVGDSNRTVSLFVSTESWAHSIQDGMVEAVGVERVEMVPLIDVLHRLQKAHPDREFVLKINVEGSAGSILLPTPAADLRSVAEIQMDHEPGSPYDLQVVLDHLAAAGLNNVTRRGERTFSIRR